MAALMPDKRTLVQAQPLARCAANGPATVLGGCIDARGVCGGCHSSMGREKTCNPWTWASADLYGDGRLGAHGGSGLSCIGGSIRAGEFMPGTPHVRHVLKVDVRLTYCSPVRHQPHPSRLFQNAACVFL